ncbi:MAG TPA: PH domain-containing protein, partial [Candidatus Bathyarchaeia archaeon]|nr:PH domain-containing protein [Candidatus Bathyarchaeia archaeon]
MDASFLDIDRKKAEQYFFLTGLPVTFCVIVVLASGLLPASYGIIDNIYEYSFDGFLWQVGVTVVLLLVTLGFTGMMMRLLARKQASALHFTLDGDTLKISGGVFWVYQKTIPLKNITDLSLRQGPLMRRSDIW